MRTNIIPYILVFAAFPLLSAAQLDDFSWSDAKYAGNSIQSKLIGSKYVYNLHASLHYFIQNDWYKGTLTTVDGELHNRIHLRYEAFNDQVIAYNENVKGLFIPDKFTVHAFTIELPDGTLQHYRKLSPDEFGHRERYFEVIHEGNVTFLNYSRIIERKASLYKNRLGKLDDRQYHLVQQYYLLIPGKPLMRIHPGRKSILSLFPDQKREIRRLIRQYRIPDYTKSSLPVIIELLDREGFF
jgi:hypothetical protein